MPKRKIGWGESQQQNAIGLVDALLSLADGEVRLDELPLKTAMRVEWVTADKLRVTGTIRQKRGKQEKTVEVGTTKKDLVHLVQKAGKCLEPVEKKSAAEKIQTVIDCLRELGILEEEPSRKNQGYWKFSLKLVHQTKRQENLDVIKQKWEEHTGQNSVETFHETSLRDAVGVRDDGINWQEICRRMLEKQRRATSNILMQEESAKFEQEQIYVPLALVERKKPDKRDRECSPEKGTQLYEPQYEETQRFEHDAFLSQILEKGEGKSQGKQIQ